MLWEVLLYVASLYTILSHFHDKSLNRLYEVMYLGCKNKPLKQYSYFSLEKYVRNE